MTIQPKILIFATHCLRSLMDRISDSGSDGCGSIPHGGTKVADKKVFCSPSFGLPNPRRLMPAPY